MNKIIADFKEALNSSPEVQEYNALAKQIKKNEFLIKTEQELKLLQQQLVDLLNEKQIDEYEKVRKDYLILKEKYENYPLYINFVQSKERLNDLLKEISAIINNL